MKKLFLLCGLVFSHNLPAGFAVGTLVKVQNGYMPIEQIKEENAVVVLKTINVAIAQTGNYVTATSVDNLVKISIDDELVFAAPDQLFFCTEGPEGRWIAASDLCVGQHIVGQGGNAAISAIEYVNGSSMAYTLFVGSPGVFFVSKYKLVVFNSPDGIMRSVKTGLANVANPRLAIDLLRIAVCVVIGIPV